MILLLAFSEGSKFARRSCLCGNAQITSLLIFAAMLLLGSVRSENCFATAKPTTMTTALVTQEFDETRENRGPFQADLVWENVTSSQQYLAGVKPKFSLRLRKSLVTLQPGESIDFLVPGHELVRVDNCSGRPNINDVEIWTSNGSGMFRRQNSAISTNGNSLIAAPDATSISVARVSHPGSCTEPVSIAVYTSRRQTPKLLDYYQCNLIDCGPAVKISEDASRPIRSYQLMVADQRRTLQVDGPTRLRFETRLKYGLDLQRRQTYWLRVYVDGDLDRVLSFDTLPQVKRRNFVDGRERMVGRREFAYLDVDYGNRKIEIETSHLVFMRVDGVGLKLCRPRINQNFALPSPNQPAKPISNWDALSLEVPTPAPGIYGTGEEVWDPYLNLQSILKLARNNEHHHGGLEAYMWMRAMASRHYNDADFGDEISVPAMAHRLRQRYTMFRDLLPTDLSGFADPQQVAFFNRRIREPDELASETIVGEQHIQDALSSLSRSRLVKIDSSQMPVQRYRIPRSVGATILRVVVDRTHLQEDTKLLVRFDDRPPIELMVNTADCVNNNAFMPGLAEAGLASLGAIHNRFDSGVVGGPFAAHGWPVPVVRAATAEIVRPAGVRNVDIEVMGPGAGNARLGLQYLVGRPTSLSESSFLHLKSLENRLEEGDRLSARFAGQELANDAMVLNKNVQAYQADFKKNVGLSPELQPTEIREPVAIEALAREANILLESKQWTAAIEVLGEIINHSTGESRRDAIISRIAALRNAGEFTLANRERKGWMLHSEDPELRSTMYKQLEADATGELSVEILASVANAENPGEGYDIELAKSLLERGKFKRAILALNSLEPSDENLEVILRSTWGMQWWRTFDRATRQIVDPQVRNFWLGLKSLHLGRYDRAIAQTTRLYQRQKHRECNFRHCRLHRAAAF